MADDSTEIRSIRYDNGDVYEGELKDGEPHGRGVYRFVHGDVYDGEWNDGLHHGTGTFTRANGDVYRGSWNDNVQHGTGTMTWNDGDVYMGQWREGKRHGKGIARLASGGFYDGEWKDNLKHGRGTAKHASGNVYVGEFKDGARTQGKMTYPSGNVYDGEWKDNLKHGKGTLKDSTGSILHEGYWANGDEVPQGMEPAGNGSASSGDSAGQIAAPSGRPSSRVDTCVIATNAGGKEQPGQEERKLRSQRSQQRRFQNSTAMKKTCENCGVDDYHYKLRVCTRCGLALYCSAACQKAAMRSHRRICDIISELPPRDSNRLTLKYEDGNTRDFDAGLRYATKYMDNLKHLAVRVDEMERDDTVKLSATKISSLLKSKKGKLDSVFWMETFCRPGIAQNGYDVWKELYGLKQLRLLRMKFDNVQHLHDIIDQQKNTLVVLCLGYLEIDWSRAKCRRTLAAAVSACKHLEKLSMIGCILTDSDLKIMLQGLPNLRTLNLRKHVEANHDFTDKTCGLIARKCPGLQELNLRHPNQFSVRGIRKIFEACVHLRSFFTTTRKLSCNDVQILLDIAPQLLFLSLGDQPDFSEEKLSQIVEATGGRTVLGLSNVGGALFQPGGVSAKTRERYASRVDLLNNIWSSMEDAEVSNEWAGCLMDDQTSKAK